MWLAGTHTPAMDIERARQIARRHTVEREIAATTTAAAQDANLAKIENGNWANEAKIFERMDGMRSVVINLPSRLDRREVIDRNSIVWASRASFGRQSLARRRRWSQLRRQDRGVDSASF